MLEEETTAIERGDRSPDAGSAMTIVGASEKGISVSQFGWIRR